MNTRTPAAILTLIAALALTLVPATIARADDGDVSWTVRTASNSLGAERTSYLYTLNPGAKVDDALVITNHGTDPLDLGVYAADGYTTDSGQFDLVVGGAKSTTVGSWLRTDSATITVDAGATVEVPFTLTVPKTATPGDYAGGIVTSLVVPDTAKNINVDRRLGIRVGLRVGGELKPGLAIENQHISWSGGFNPFAGGDATLSYTIHNTGNSMLSAQQAASASGPFGWFAVASGKPTTVPRLLPGESWKVSVPFHGVAAAVWVGATASVTPVVVDAAGSTSTLSVVSATAVGWAVPWTLLIFLLIIVAAILGGPRLLRRYRSARKAREDQRINEAVAAALRSADEKKVTADA